MTDIAVVGSWHLAHVMAACLAEIGHYVTLYFDEPRSIDEPFLAEMETKWIEKDRLRHGSLECSLGLQSVVWLADDTPLDAAGGPDTAGLFKLTGRLRTIFPDLELVIVSSQVPIGTCRRIEHQLTVPVAYVPENLRLGTAISDFIYSDRLVVGAEKVETRKRVLSLMSHLVGLKMMSEATAPMLCSLETAEMVKHVTNAFLATSISFANEMAVIGARFDVDNAVLTKALRADTRIGPRAYVRAGEGFAPGTLARDLKALQWAGKCGGVPTWLVDAVLAVNDVAPQPASRPHDEHLKGHR